MSGVQSKLLFIYNGAGVKRFHTHTTIKEHTVGQHSHAVAMLVWLLTSGNCSKPLLMAALTHDLPEQDTGDIPSPFKRSMPGLRANVKCFDDAALRQHDFDFLLTEEEKRVLALADSLDGIMSCIAERRLGSRCLDGVCFTFRNYVGNLTLATGSKIESDVIDAVLRMWFEVADQ